MRMTNEDVWKTLQKTSGEITGPVIFDFVCWVLDEAVRRKIKTLYFLARDGYILHKIAGLVVKKFDLPVTCKYLYCSRNSLRLPTYHFIGEEAYEILFLSGYNVTVNSLLARGSLSDSKKKQICCELKMDKTECDKPLSKLELRDIAEQFRGNQTYCNSIRAASLNAYPETIGYLKQEGLFEQEQVAIVDSGWTGSLQRSLRQLMYSAGFTGTIIGFYFGMYTQPKSQLDGTYLTWYFNEHGRALDKALFCNNLFECILAAPHGMTLAYQKQNGIYTPCLAQGPGESDFRFVQIQIEGILNYVESVLSKGPIKFERQTALKNARKRLHRFMAHPTRAEASAFGEFLFDDDVKDENKRALADEKQITLLKDYFIPIRILRRLKKNCGHIPELFWAYGTIALLPKTQKRRWYWWNVCVWELLKYKVHEITLE